MGFLELWPQELISFVIPSASVLAGVCLGRSRGREAEGLGI